MILEPGKFILCIESSTNVCSVALGNHAGLHALMERREAGIHARELHPMIEQLLRKEQVVFSDLSAVVVGSGPGSYTGLRIGVSAAKGLCLALGIPLIAVNSLEALGMAMALKFKHYDYFMPMTDARRMEVYTLVMNRHGEVVQPTYALIADETSPDAWLPEGNVLLVGDGSEKIFNAFNTNSRVQAYADELPSSAHLLTPALKRFQLGMFEDLSAFEPFYLKEFMATKPRNLLR